MRRKVARAFTLIEMLIVIALIGIIGSALAYNLGAGLSKGKAFKTEQNKRKIRNILEYEIFNNGGDPDEVAKNWEHYVRGSSLVDQEQKIEELIYDAYGQQYQVSYDAKRDQMVVRSSREKES